MFSISIILSRSEIRSSIGSRIDHHHHQRRRKGLIISLRYIEMERERGGADDAVLVRTAALIFVTLTSAVSAYRSAAAGDAGSTAFVGVSYATLLLLFRSLRAYERCLPPAGGGGAEASEAAGGRRRAARLRREVWALCTLLTVLFSWKVAAAMPSWPVAAAVWAMAALTTAAGYVALFFHRRP